MFAPYRRVLSRPGAPAFFLTGLVARSPMAMIGLGIVLLVSGVQGSYGLAGLLAAAFVLAQGAMALPQGQLLDRYGQSTVLLPAAVVSNLALVALAVAVVQGAGTPLMLLLAVVAGASFPQVGSAVRARWSWMLRGDTRGKDTAFALEGVADECAFVVGPVLVTLLATTLHPTVGLLTAAVVALVGTTVFTRLRATQPPTGVAAGAPARARRLGWRLLAPATGVAIGLGALFGGMEVAVVAFSEEQGRRSASGLLLAVWALSSLVAGVATGLVSWRIDAATRMRRFSAAFAILVLPLPLVPNLLVLTGLLLVIGVMIAPTLIAMVSAVESGAATGRLTESLAVVHTGLAVGVALGAAGAGAVVDTAGGSAAFLVPVAAIAVGAVAAQATRPRRDTPSGPRVATPEHEAARQ